MRPAEDLIGLSLRDDAVLHSALRFNYLTCGQVEILLSIVIPFLPTLSTFNQSSQAPSAATVLPADKPALDGATLLDTRCSACHSADRAKQAKKTREQWDQTVTRMIGKGAKLTEAEKGVLLDYLAKTFGP